MSRLLTYLLMCVLGWLHAQCFSASWGWGSVLQWVILGVAWALVAQTCIVASIARAARRMFAFAWTYFVTGLYWVYFSMHDIGGLPQWWSWLAIALLAAYLALYPMIAAVAWGWVSRRLMGSPLVLFLLVLPGLWLGAELGRGYVLTGFPWLMTGYAHIDSIWLRGYYPLVGAYGVAAVAAVASGWVAFLLLYLYPRFWPFYASSSRQRGGGVAYVKNSSCAWRSRCYA